jgi:hypothetical protein
MVLTDRDHMEFMTNILRDSDLAQDRDPMLPSQIKRWMVQHSWFFVGYSAADRTLRNVVRALGSQLNNPRKSFAVQLQREDAVVGRTAEADAFLTKFFNLLLPGTVDVVLQDAKTFLTAIRNS